MLFVNLDKIFYFRILRAAVKPIALRFITQMKQHPDLVNVPITGEGGIETWRMP